MLLSHSNFKSAVSFAAEVSRLTTKIENKMRRTHTNYAYEPLPTTSSHGGLEDENERMTEHLKDKIHALKSLSIDIGNEVQYQDKMLHGMDEDFERTSGLLTSSVARVLRLSKGSHAYYILYLMLFSIFVFFVLWVTLKFF